MADQTYTATQKRDAALREVKMRQFVYPNRIGARKMTQEKADFEIGVMQAIAADYDNAAEADHQSIDEESAKDRLL